MAFLKIFLVLLMAPNPLYADTLTEPEDSALSKEFCTSLQPVTDTCVEAGLRKKREVLRNLPEFQGGGAEAHMRLADLLMQQGDPNGAIEEYQAALRLNSEKADAYKNLGAVYLDKHDWRLAEQSLQIAAELNDQDSQTFYWLGRSLLAQKKLDDAEQALSTATKLNGADPEGYSDLALAFMAQGRGEEAAQALQQAIRLRPDFSEAHARLELIGAFEDNRKLLAQKTLTVLDMLFQRH